MRTRIVLVLALAAAAAVAATASGRGADTPGVTATSILLGGTEPLAGEDAAAAAISRGANAYFQYVNSLGGVYGRKITYKIVDDGYDPARTVEATRSLVQDDKVFAIYGSLGTNQNLAIRDFLNE